MHLESNLFHGAGCYIRLAKPSWRNFWMVKRTELWKEYADAWLDLAHELGLLEEDIWQQHLSILETLGQPDTLLYADAPADVEEELL